MKKLVLALAVLALLAGLASAQFHNPVFLSSGFRDITSTYGYPVGLWMVDGKNGTSTSIFPSWMKSNYIYDAKMDVDNKKIVFVANHTTSSAYNVKSGIFRYDPSTQTLQTIVQNNYPNDGPMYYQYRMFVNQDGDYVFGAYGRSTQSSRIQYDYNILKYDAASNLTTVFTLYMLGTTERAFFTGMVGTDIDTGDYLTNTGYFNSNSASKLGPYPWIQIDPRQNGMWSTFAAGPYLSYYGNAIYYNGLNQDYATGDIQEIEYGRIYNTKRNGTGFTTLWNWGFPGGWGWRYAGARDLQSAPVRQWACPAYIRKQVTSTWYWYKPYVGLMGENPFTMTPVNCDTSNALDGMRYGPTYYNYAFGFYQNRNIASVKTGANQWQLRLSCPNYPKKRYFMVIGQSGIRPGVPLPSGRTIWINFDVFVFLSLNNILLPFFSAGPGVLDANGEAQGLLNTNLVAPLNGATVHIAAMVMDAAAPDGIAFIPDTHVMKLP